MEQHPADLQDILALKQGDDLALNRLMNRWKQPLVSYLYRYVGHKHDAVELAQETFIRVYQQCQRFKGHGQFSTWLFSIATNLAKNHLRWRSRHATVAMQELDDESHSFLQSTASTPKEQLEEQERNRALEKAVAELPEDWRSAWLLADCQHLTYLQAGEALGRSPKTVEAHVYKARNFLRQKLASWGA